MWGGVEVKEYPINGTWDWYSGISLSAPSGTQVIGLKITCTYSTNIYLVDNITGGVYGRPLYLDGTIDSGGRVVTRNENTISLPQYSLSHVNTSYTGVLYYIEPLEVQ